MINRELGAAIESAIGQLDPRFREAVILASDGHCYLDIASMTGVGIDTVKSRIHRGRQRLRILLVEVLP
jgi:RNA polymerase sigma-70 factor (ECF subfamily)